MTYALLIESPFKGETAEKTQENIDYARECLTYFYCNFAAPIALHLVYPFLPDGKLHLDDEKVENNKFELPGRDYALGCNQLWRKKIGHVVFCLDKGISEGMKRALIECYRDSEIRVQYRFLYSEADEELLQSIKTYAKFRIYKYDSRSGYLVSDVINMGT
jgi:hypothetical protein